MVFILKKDEVSFVNNVLNFLGKNDSENQIAGLKNYSSQIQNYIQNSNDEYKKVGSISTKLGFLFGLAVAICLI